jgi:hypothetical protein
MVSLEAHEKYDNLPRRAKIESWPVSGHLKQEKASMASISAIQGERDEIVRRVFALFLDHWRNMA